MGGQEKEEGRWDEGEGGGGGKNREASKPSTVLHFHCTPIDEPSCVTQTPKHLVKHTHWDSDTNYQLGTQLQTQPDSIVKVKGHL